MDQALLTTFGRRSAHRVCVRSDVGLLDEENNQRTLAELRDLSTTGACVRTPAPLPVGQRLRLAFEFLKGSGPVRVRAEVVWSDRAEGRRGGILSGLRFRDLGGDELGRLRKFIEERLFVVQQFLSKMARFSDLSDLDRMLLASVSLDLTLAAGATLPEALRENALLAIRTGSVQAEEISSDGRASGPRRLAAGDLCGSLPVDPRGASLLELRAIEDSDVIVLPSDGFWYLSSLHADTALKLLACFAQSLIGRLHQPRGKR